MAVVVYVMRFAPVPVVGHTVARGEIVAEVLGTGTLESRVQVTISPKISGRIQEILANQGDRVTQCQPLVQLDDAGVARAEAAIAEGQQQVTTAEKTLAYQQARLADSTITVPFDGLIVRRQRDSGDVVVPGSPILQLVALEQLWISAWIDETEMARVAVGQPARIAFRSEPERSYPGSVTRLGREADRETREFVVDVQVLELPTNWAVGLLLMIVMGMGGIYRGLIEDATLLTEKIGSDLWVVQHDTRGPFAGLSRVPANLVHRVAAVPGVASAREFVYHTIQRERDGHPLRISVLGLSWPTDKGEWVPLIAGRPLAQNHFEMIADRTLGLRLGERVRLGKDLYEVVGISANMISSSGDGIGGTLVVDGPHPETNLSAFRRKYIGYVFQKSNLIPFLTACENVQIALELNGFSSREARRKSLELLDYLGVSERERNLPSMLSGGQQQRVVVARALANRPSLLLADEPTAALDCHRGRQVMELFAQVAHEHGTGVIVVTHDQRSLDVFDTIYEMEDGLIRQAAPSHS